MNFIFLCEILKEMILLCMDWHRSDFHHLQQKSDPSMKRQWIENIRPEGKTDIQMKTIEIFLISKPSSRTWLKYIFFNTGMEAKNLTLKVVNKYMFAQQYFQRNIIYLRDGMHGAITMFRSLTSWPEPRNRLGQHSKRLSLSLKCVSNAEKL